MGMFFGNSFLSIFLISDFFQFDFSFQKGDVVECQIDQLGSIINKVV